MITYRELLESLQSLNEEELNQTATVRDQGTDEIYGVAFSYVTDSAVEDRLDDKHLVLAFNTPFEE